VIKTSSILYRECLLYTQRKTRSQRSQYRYFRS